jgi:polyisoprenoid-binding protein YceI
VKALTFAFMFMALTCSNSWAKVWIVDKESSEVSFSLNINGHPVSGRFENWWSSIRFDENHPEAAQVRVVFDLRQVVTGDGTRDRLLKSQQWFDVEGVSHDAESQAVNEAVFETVSVRRTDVDTYSALGTLYMRGISHQVVLTFELGIEGDLARMRSSLSIDRTIWGVGQGEFADENPVSTQVAVNIDLKAVSQ